MQWFKIGGYTITPEEVIHLHELLIGSKLDDPTSEKSHRMAALNLKKNLKDTFSDVMIVIIPRQDDCDEMIVTMPSAVFVWRNKTPPSHKLSTKELINEDNVDAEQKAHARQFLKSGGEFCSAISVGSFRWANRAVSLPFQALINLIS